jgi:oligopeptide/dipeptide ABC transporter ATP-binding protein
MLEVKGLRKNFTSGVISKKVVKAVDGVSFTIPDGSMYGLVGESGCGKTTVGRLLLRLAEPSSGEVIFNGTDLARLSKRQMRKLRPKMQIIFQDPESSLNPRMRIEDIIAEPMRYHKLVPAKDIREKVLSLLDDVGLQEEHLNRFPHELSGGQNQRVAFARVLSLNPEFIVADEPTSALDVSVQAQILTLLKKLQKEYGFSCLFISHDLNLVRMLTENVGVMYLGKIVEQGPTEQVFSRPLHPYTRALISSVPVPDPRKRRNRIVLEGEMPSPMAPPAGCAFHPRCSLCTDSCSASYPALRSAGSQTYACHREMMGIPFESPLQVIAPRV